MPRTATGSPTGSSWHAVGYSAFSLLNNNSWIDSQIFYFNYFFIFVIIQFHLLVSFSAHVNLSQPHHGVLGV